jgi:hypothetical protein
MNVTSVIYVTVRILIAIATSKYSSYNSLLICISRFMQILLFVCFSGGSSVEYEMLKYSLAE